MEAGRRSMLFGEVNERIAELLERAWPTAPGDFLCECDVEECSRRVTLSLGAYRGLRARGEAVVSAGCLRRADAAGRPRPAAVLPRARVAAAATR